MKLSLVVLAALFAIAFAVPVDDKKAYLERQKFILDLFYHIHQPLHNKEYVEIATNFNINDHIDNYKNSEVVKYFLELYKYDRLSRGEIFSIFNNHHLQQAIALFKLFHNAKDWDTFYKTAIWARQNVNEGVFVYAFSVYIIHHKGEHQYFIPPIYEIFPNYFFGAEVIQKAQQLKQIHHTDEHKIETHIDSNYSGWYLNLHEEQSLSYFLEDVDVNAAYYYYNLFYPSWMSSEEYGWDKDLKRGEIFYYYHLQILARNYLERLANGFGTVPFIDSDTDIETPYEPSLVYPNGLPFPSRPAFAKVNEYYTNYGQKWGHNVYGYSRRLLKDRKRRLADAIDSGFVLSEKGKWVELYTEDGINTLGNIIDSNPDSLHQKYYGPLFNYARHLYGYSLQPLDDHKLVPSALEHYETSIRDPVFFQILKRVINQFRKYMLNIHPYTEKDLVLPGVKITKFEVDNLITYDDYFHADLSNALWWGPEEKHRDFIVRVRQQRQNHKQFTYKIHVKSDKAQKVSVKVFIGPKYDEYGRHINLTENHLNFVELSHTIHDIQEGENVITKHCHENVWYSPDRVGFSELYHQVIKALEGNGEFKVDFRQNYFSFPQRYMLPRGSKEGFPVQFFVAVYPFKGKEHHHEEHHILRVGTGDIWVDNYPAGYPLNRHIKFENMWYRVPNFYFHEDHVYHKDVHEVNAPHH